jgi:hypothetical protein
MHELRTLALEFSDQVSIGNILTIIFFLFGGLAAFYDLREKAKTNRIMITDLVRRLDHAEIEKLADRVTTMWMFQLRRGMGELETKGLGFKKSRDDE